MKRTLKSFKNAGILFMILGIIMLSSFAKIDGPENYEVLFKCAGALVFLTGGTALVYASEKESRNHDQQEDNTY